MNPADQPSHKAAGALRAVNVAILGTGSMGEALLRGLLQAGAITPAAVTVTARRDERCKQLAAAYGVAATPDNVAAAARADVVVLAVKPQQMEPVLRRVRDAVGARALVVSVASGVCMPTMERHLVPGARVCRAMPNTPAVVGAAATAIARGTHASDLDMDLAQAIFAAVGTVTEVDEGLLDAVTGLSGSGPAYVFLIIEALADAGVKVGLPRYKALDLAAQTVLGSAKLLLQTGAHPGVLKDQVTSPGGCAIAGLHTLEEGGLRTTLINAVVTATERSRQLGAMLADR